MMRSLGQEYRTNVTSVLALACLFHGPYETATPCRPRREEGNPLSRCSETTPHVVAYRRREIPRLGARAMELWRASACL